MTMNRTVPRPGRQGGFTLFEVLIALGVFAIAVVGLITALNTAMQAAIEVRERSLLRAELESQLAVRLGIPLDSDTLVIEAKDNRGIRVEETIVPYPLKNKDDEEIANIKKLTITATLNQQSDSASILVNQ
jgi:prepilin-type N-terminal cleavage/methylation domain-containing protein